MGRGFLLQRSVESDLRGTIMTNNGNWERKIREAAAYAEADVQRLIKYINDEVVPDVRRNGSEALKIAAKELQKLAERMDDSKKTPPPAA
jgi:hypothetical protein